MNRLFCIALVLSLWGCAQQVAPTGGAKDEIPPKILSELPSNLSTNFQSKQIVISFDEFIQFKNAAEQVLISPPMLKSPSYQLKKKSLVISFEQELAENTTYTINFGEAIRDNNEGNILTNYTYVFSTGPHLDSMEVKGKLSDVLNADAVEGALVMLYKNDVDSLPLDTIPDYFTRTGSNGSFHLQNVANQPYKIFALLDENSNYKFDVQEEQIGFLDSLILPYAAPIAAKPDTTKPDSVIQKINSQPLPSYDLTMFVEEDTTQFLKKSYCDYFGKLVFVYNQPVGQLDVALADAVFKSQWMLKDFSTNRDSIFVWTTGVVPDTLSLVLTANKSQIDSVELIMKPRTDNVESEKKSKGFGKKKKIEKFALTAISIPAKGRSPKPDAGLKLIWNHPIVDTDLSRIKLYEDSIRVNYDISSTDTSLRVFDIRYPWKKDARYQLLLVDSAFEDIYQLQNDTLDFSFVGVDKKSFGELSINLMEEPKTQLVIEVLNASNNIVDYAIVNAKGIVQFTGLNPGNYNIQVIRDYNKNGRWDSGRYSVKLQPEPIHIIESGAEVRPSWDLELEWNPNEN